MMGWFGTVFGLLWALSALQPVGEVVARFESETLTPLTGQPFELTLVVERPPGVILTDWPVIADPWGAFEVRSVGERVEEVRADGGVITRQAFTVVLWLPRDVVTPETFIGYSLGAEDVRRVPVREVFISVPTVVDPLAPELIPARPLIQPPSPWGLWLALGAVVAGGAALMVLRQRRRTELIVPLTPREQTIRALSVIQMDVNRPANERLREALSVVSGLGQHIALSESLLSLVRAAEELAYSGQPVSDGQVRGFIGRAVRLINGEGVGV
jgi:hypothetical protein